MKDWIIYAAEVQQDFELNAASRAAGQWNLFFPFI